MRGASRPCRTWCAGPCRVEDGVRRAPQSPRTHGRGAARPRSTGRWRGPDRCRTDRTLTRRSTMQRRASSFSHPSTSPDWQAGNGHDRMAAHNTNRAANGFERGWAEAEKKRARDDGRDVEMAPARRNRGLGTIDGLLVRRIWTRVQADVWWGNRRVARGREMTGVGRRPGVGQCRRRCGGGQERGRRLTAARRVVILRT